MPTNCTGTTYFHYIAQRENSISAIFLHRVTCLVQIKCKISQFQMIINDRMAKKIDTRKWLYERESFINVGQLSKVTLCSRTKQFWKKYPFAHLFLCLFLVCERIWFRSRSSSSALFILDNRLWRRGSSIEKFFTSTITVHGISIIIEQIVTGFEHLLRCRQLFCTAKGKIILILKIGLKCPQKNCP